MVYQARLVDSFLWSVIGDFRRVSRRLLMSPQVKLMRQETQSRLDRPRVWRRALLDFLSGDLMHSPSGDQQLGVEVLSTNFPSAHIYIRHCKDVTVSTGLPCWHCHQGQGSVTKTAFQRVVLGQRQGGRAAWVWWGGLSLLRVAVYCSPRGIKQPSDCSHSVTTQLPSD